MPLRSIDVTTKDSKMVTKVITKKARDIVVNDEIRVNGGFRRVVHIKNDDMVGSDNIYIEPENDKILCVKKSELFKVRVHKSQTRVDPPALVIYKTALSGENGEIICETSDAGVTITTIGFLTEQEYRKFLYHEMKRLDI